jgi:hypothetical protein
MDTIVLAIYVYVYVIDVVDGTAWPVVRHIVQRRRMSVALLHPIVDMGGSLLALVLVVASF